jgi:hypothetical protein
MEKHWGVDNAAKKNNRYSNVMRCLARPVSDLQILVPDGERFVKSFWSWVLAATAFLKVLKAS